MNGSEVLRIVDAIHRDKSIDKGIVFEGIEQAILSAARKHYGEESAVVVIINRESGEPAVTYEGAAVNADELGVILGRISAQTAKQVMIQKIREAERDSLHDEYTAIRTQIVSGVVSRLEGGAATVNLGKVEGFLPRSEQIPGESYRVNERVRATVLDVKKAGSRVKIILSRAHPDFVRRLFELEIPEVGERVIEVRSIAREAGYRSKVAVSCYDSKIDAVGACVGVRGSRIKNIVDELAGERIDIVRWNDSLQVLVPNALQPAEVEDVILCPMLGKVIVLVRDDQLSLAIGKKGQNVRLASKLVGWDIHVLTQEKLDEQLDKSVQAFSIVPGVTSELAENLVAQGFFTYDDLSVIEPDQLAELGGLTDEQCDEIVSFADVQAARIEEEEKRAHQEDRRIRAAEAALQQAEAMGGRSAPRPKPRSLSEAEKAVAESPESAKAPAKSNGQAVAAEGGSESVLAKLEPESSEGAKPPAEGDAASEGTGGSASEGGEPAT